MIKGLIFDIGDVIYDIPLKYKEFSPFLIQLGIEQILFKVSSFFTRHGFYKKSYTDDEIQKLRLRIKPRPGVVRTLKQLKQKKIKVVFLTDTIQSPCKIDSRMNALGVADYVDKVVCSSQINTYKPHKAAYDAAIKSIGASNSEILFVGHAKDELDGAHKAGLKTIGYNLDPWAKADYYVDFFSDILKVVGELNAKRRHNRP